MLLGGVLETDFHKKTYQNFLEEEKSKFIPKFSQSEILVKRLSIEEHLKRIIKKYNNTLKVSYIKNIIYNENDQRELDFLINLFSSVEDFSELQRIIAVIVDAWNYWPHKSLEGLSPVEKAIQ